MPKKLTAAEKAAVKAERAKRNAKPFTVEAIAGGDTPQRRYLMSQAPFTVALCSKRAGKSYANMVLLALTAMATPAVTALYLGLNMESIEYQIIHKLWNPLVKKYGLPFTEINSDHVAICTANNSIVRFASVADAQNISKFMGDTLAGGIVIIDESQEIPFKTLDRLVEEVILPSLSDVTDDHPVSGRLVLSGTVPEVPGGYFYKKFVDDNGWDKHNWSRLQNPFLRNQQQELEKVMAALGVDANDTRIKRLWFGDVTAFEESDLAYQYKADRSTYVPTKIERRDIGPFHCAFADATDLDRFVVGIDPAHRKDRYAIVCLGWNSKRKDRLVQVAEAVTEPGADPFDTEWHAILIELKRRYGTAKFVYDPGSTGGVLDSLYRTHGIIIEPAVKGPGSIKRRVSRYADLLKRGVARVIEGGHLDSDLQTAKWDQNALLKGEWKLDKANGSPDVSDAASYAVGVAFTEIGAQQEQQTFTSETEYWRRQMEIELNRRFTAPAPRPPRARDLLWTPPR